MADSKLQIIIDVAADKAKSAFGQLKTDIGEAEGAFGKFKAGGKGALDAVGGAGPAATAAIGAVVAIGLQAVSAFQDAALNADKFAKSLGSSPEDASRLLAVFKPLNIELGDAQDVFNNLAGIINENEAALNNLGVTVARDASGRVDMNETFIRLSEAIGKIEDPARRAAEMAKYFGEEGARQFGPLIADADNLRSKLEAVGEAQVIDQDEIDKAERLREAQVKLKEALDTVMMAIGEIIAGFGPFIDQAAQAAQKVADLASKLEALQKVAMFVVDPIGQFDDVVKGLGNQIKMVGVNLDDFKAQMDDAGISTDEQTKFIEGWRAANTEAGNSLVELGDKTADTTAAIDDNKASMDYAAARAEYYESRVAGVKEETAKAEEATRKLDDAFKELYGQLDEEEAWDNVQKQLSDYRTKMDDAKASNDEKRQSIRDTKRELLDFASTMKDEIPPEKMTRIVAAIERGDFDQAERDLEWLSRPRTVPLNPATGGQAAKVERKANGGAAGGATIVGERGPELVDLPNGSYVHTAAETRRINRAPSVVQHIYLPPALNSGAQMAELDRLYRKANGLL